MWIFTSAKCNKPSCHFGEALGQLSTIQDPWQVSKVEDTDALDFLPVHCFYIKNESNYLFF